MVILLSIIFIAAGIISVPIFNDITFLIFSLIFGLPNIISYAECMIWLYIKYYNKKKKQQNELASI